VTLFVETEISKSHNKQKFQDVANAKFSFDKDDLKIRMLAEMRIESMLSSNDTHSEINNIFGVMDAAVKCIKDQGTLLTFFNNVLERAYYYNNDVLKAKCDYLAQQCLTGNHMDGYKQRTNQRVSEALNRSEFEALEPVYNHKQKQLAQIFDEANDLPSYMHRLKDTNSEFAEALRSFKEFKKSKPQSKEECIERLVKMHEFDIVIKKHLEQHLNGLNNVVSRLLDKNKNDKNPNHRTRNSAIQFLQDDLKKDRSKWTIQDYMKVITDINKTRMIAIDNSKKSGLTGKFLNKLGLYGSETANKLAGKQSLKEKVKEKISEKIEKITHRHKR
jgi:hypothetical protein